MSNKVTPENTKPSTPLDDASRRKLELEDEKNDSEAIGTFKYMNKSR